MSAPLKPHWHQPSHPEIQQVVPGADGGDFSSKSLSKVRVAPFGVFADMTFPPCTLVGASTYATVQISRDRHILLNSDLLYLNHSCEPSLVSIRVYIYLGIYIYNTRRPVSGRGRGAFQSIGMSYCTIHARSTLPGLDLHTRCLFMFFSPLPFHP